MHKRRSELNSLCQNAEFVADYPNLPAWITHSTVYGAWFAVTSVGVAGIVLVQLRLRLLGLVFIAGYATLGFAGLDHYWAAPMSAHTSAMNATIWLEAVAAAALLLATLAQLFRSGQRSGAIGA